MRAGPLNEFLQRESWSILAENCQDPPGKEGVEDDVKESKHKQNRGQREESHLDKTFKVGEDCAFSDD